MPTPRTRKPDNRKAYDTRLDRFVRRERVGVDALAQAAGMSRQNLGRLRSGRRHAREDTIARLVVALRRMLNKPVKAADLFYLGEEQDDHTTEARRFRERADTSSDKGPADT